MADPCYYQGEAGAAGAGGQAGAAGAGGAGGEAATAAITIGSNAFVGDYLQDQNQRALYVFGADLAGDCAHEPVTTCFDSCTIAWPVFYQATPEIAAGLDGSAFGSFLRPDGALQTTYRGWPLYYFRRDEAAGDVLGHGAGRIWHLAEVELPNIVILRIEDERMLADGRGRVLYSFDSDRPGNPLEPPVSACFDDCLQEFTPFMLPHLAPVSYLEPTDFQVFIRSDTRAQLAYRGLPLYLSRQDQRSGDRRDGDMSGFSVVIP